MFKSLSTAATGMIAQQNHIDAISNNLANVNTTGFKRQRAEFQDLVYQTLRTAGGQTASGNNIPVGYQVGSGVRTVATVHQHTQGNLSQTDNPLDLAIEGAGFFQIRRPNGDIAYSRAGNLKTDVNGSLVTVDGFVVEPEISIPTDTTSVTVSAEGVVSVTTANRQTAQEVGRLQLANFVNPAGLQAMGRGLFVPTSASGDVMLSDPGHDGVGTIAQGFLESSNVDVVQEMINLITSQRAYDINQRVIDASDEMLRRLTQR